MPLLNKHPDTRLLHEIEWLTSLYIYCVSVFRVINVVNRGVLNFSLCSHQDCSKPKFKTSELEFLDASIPENVTVGS